MVVLSEELRPFEAEMVAKMMHRLTQSDNLNDALESLYGVTGFDDFALRLMWLADQSGNGIPTEQVLERESILLAGLIPNRGKANGSTSSPVVRELQNGTDGFYDSLHAFGRSIRQLRRESYPSEEFSGLTPQMVDRLLHAVSELQHAAEVAGKPEVRSFTETLGAFMQFIVERHFLQDIRVLNLIESANLTLQTVLESPGSEDYEALRQTTELLASPKLILA